MTSLVALQAGTLDDAPASGAAALPAPPLSAAAPKQETPQQSQANAEANTEANVEANAEAATDQGAGQRQHPGEVHC